VAVGFLPQLQPEKLEGKTAKEKADRISLAQARRISGQVLMRRVIEQNRRIFFR